MKQLIFLFFLILGSVSSAQFPMLTAWQGQTRVPLVTDSLSGLFIAGDVIDSLGRMSGDTTYLFPNRARWLNPYAFDHAYQLTASRKPIVYDSSGAKYLAFDGVDDFIRSAPLGQHTQPYTAIILAFAYKGLANQMIYSTGTSDAAIRSYVMVSPNTEEGVLHAQSNLVFLGVRDSIIAYRAIANGATSSVWLNGILVATGNPQNEGVDGLTFGAFGTGGTNRLKGYIFGVAFYHKVLTPLEAAAVELWLREECLQ